MPKGWHMGKRLPGESCGHANLTSSRGSEGDNSDLESQMMKRIHGEKIFLENSRIPYSDLGPLVSSCLAASLLHQGATRVTL